MPVAMKKSRRKPSRKKEKAMKLNLCGGLFNAGERLHNLFLEKHLKGMGYEVILPQREALKFFDGEKFDLAGIVNSCQENCIVKDIIFVGCIDGADADSGTCVEYGMAIAATGRAIVYRTDMRTALDREVGLNAMLNAQGTQLIYFPCFTTQLHEVEIYYASLAQKIHEAVQNICAYAHN